MIYLAVGTIMIAEQQLKCNLDFTLFLMFAEKNCRGIEESRMERASDDDSISGGSPADSYPTCIFRLTPSLFHRMKRIVSASERAMECCKFENSKLLESYRRFFLR